MQHIKITTITTPRQFIGLNRTTEKTQTPQEENSARKAKE
jgi:hypothetical protein